MQGNQRKAEYPFCALVDTQPLLSSDETTGIRKAKHDLTMIKCFEVEDIEIKSINFGPLDNGPIVLGLNNGYILVLS